MQNASSYTSSLLSLSLSSFRPTKYYYVKRDLYTYWMKYIKKIKEYYLFYLVLRRLFIYYFGVAGAEDSSGLSNLEFSSVSESADEVAVLEADEANF